MVVILGPMKVEHEAKLDRKAISMLRWMYGFNLKDNKKLQSLGNYWDWINQLVN